MKKILIGLMAFICALDAGAACTNVSLKGYYGYVYSAMLFSTGEYCTGNGRFYSDGKGTISLLGVDACNGVATTAQGTGSYTVYDGCTGAFSVNGINYYFTLVSGKKSGVFTSYTTGISGSGSFTKQ